MIEPVSVETAPPFEVTSFDNKTCTLQDLKGETILMEFWSPDERFSGKVRAWVEYIVSKYGDRLTVLSVMIRPDKSVYEEYLKNHKLSSLAVRSTDDLKKIYSPDTATPAFYVIDKTGTIRFKGPGITVIEVVDKLVEKIL